MYILSKSPSKANMEDFWALIEKQHVTSVVMVTAPQSPSHKVCRVLASMSLATCFLNKLKKKMSKEKDVVNQYCSV